ncbi:MAG: hypothetical protein AB7I41_11505 [Candidatus Sericytochromatia bacterium]
MDSVQIHLLLNHAPIMGSLLATALLAWGLLRKNEEVVRVSLYILVGSALAALPVYFSGEGAEEAVEHLPGVVENLIEDHEHLAKVAIMIMEGLGLAALGGIFFSFRKVTLPLWYAGLLLTLGLINGGVMAQTAHLGGLIRHSEIRSGAAKEQNDKQLKEQPKDTTEQKNESKKENDHDHDD